MVLRAAASSATKKAAVRGKADWAARAESDGTASVVSSRSAASNTSAAASSRSAASSRTSASRGSSLAASLSASWSALTRSKGSTAKRGPALDSGPRRAPPLGDVPEDVPGAEDSLECDVLPAGEAAAAASSGCGKAADLGGAATSAGGEAQGKQAGEVAEDGRKARPRPAALGAPVFSEKSAGRGTADAARHSASLLGNSQASAGGGRRAGATVQGRAGGVSAKQLSQPSPPQAAAVAAEVSSDEWEGASPRAFEATFVATPRSVASSQVSHRCFGSSG